MEKGDILVTGATGHTGRRLVQRLLEIGYPVRILTREPSRLPLELRKQVRVCRTGIEDAAELQSALRGCGAVIATTHIKLAPPILAAMTAENVRRGIFMSSTRRFTRFPEITAEQVIAGEKAVEESGLEITIIRPSMIYGGPQDNNLEHLLAELRRWPIHPLVGGGRMKWQPVFTWDVVSAMVAALEKPDTIGKSYTIAGPEPLTYRRMIEIMLREAGLKRLLLPVALPAVRMLVQIYEKLSRHPRLRMDQIQRLEEDKVFDISEARRELDFNPVSFDEGIRRKLAGTA